MTGIRRTSSESAKNHFDVSNVNAAFTLDTSRWFFADSLLVLLIPVTMACYAFYAARGGEPLLGRRILD